MPDDWLKRMGYTMAKEDLDVDEDLPNFWKALPAREADRLICENSQMQKEYGFELNESSLIKQLEEEVSPWIECSISRKRDLIKMWKSKWNWDIDVDKLVDNSSHSPPWGSVRLIGHRGSGKTARPVLQ